LSRRRFLAAAGGGAALLGGSCWHSGSQVDPQHFVLLSDPHVWADREHTHVGVKPADEFVKARERILALRPRPAGLFINGDCACLEGHAADYAVLRELLEPIRRAGIALHFTLGNHDQRDAFHTAFHDLLPAASPVAEKLVTLVETPAADCLLLDSLERTNSTPGRLGQAQLDWLSATLDARAGRPAIVMAHHNPEPKSLAGKPKGLIDGDDLLNVLLPRKQAKLYFFGHTHRWEQTERDGLPLLNLPTTVWVFDAKQPHGWVDAHLHPTGISLQLHALNRRHPADGQCWSIAWRV